MLLVNMLVSAGQTTVTARGFCQRIVFMEMTYTNAAIALVSAFTLPVRALGEGRTLLHLRKAADRFRRTLKHAKPVNLSLKPLNLYIRALHTWAKHSAASCEGIAVS